MLPLAGSPKSSSPTRRSVLSADIILKEGSLWKKGSGKISSAWRLRLFVLTINNDLIYHKDVIEFCSDSNSFRTNEKDALNLALDDILW